MGTLCGHLCRTAEPIEMPYGLWARMGHRDHGGLEVLRDIAMATNFGTKIAINWLCVNDSDWAIGYGGEFEWSADRMQIFADIL